MTIVSKMERRSENSSVNGKIRTRRIKVVSTPYSRPSGEDNVGRVGRDQSHQPPITSNAKVSTSSGFRNVAQAGGYKKPKYQVGHLNIMCEYKGVNFPVKILQIKRKSNFSPGQTRMQNVTVNAKIFDAAVKATDYIYLVHYIGWGKRWDEWVAERQISSENDPVLAEQRSPNVPAPLKKSQRRNSNSTATQQDNLQEATSSAQQQIVVTESLPIIPRAPIIVKNELNTYSSLEDFSKLLLTALRPENSFNSGLADMETAGCMKNLKSILEFDFEQIKCRNMLIRKTPHLVITIDTLLNDFVTSLEQIQPQLHSVKYKLHALAMRYYVDTKLNVDLMYIEERVSYMKTVSEQLRQSEDKIIEKCNLFAPVHLLRLMAKMCYFHEASIYKPSEHGFSWMKDEKIKLLLFLNQNREKYFPESVYYDKLEEARTGQNA